MKKFQTMTVAFVALLVVAGCDKPDYDRAGGPDPTQRSTGSGSSTRNSNVGQGRDVGQESVNASQIQSKGHSTNTSSSRTGEFKDPDSGTGSLNP